VVEARSAAGKDFGVVLLPEGLIEFVPEVGALIAEINELLAATPEADAGRVSSGLSEKSRQVPFLSPTPSLTIPTPSDATSSSRIRLSSPVLPHEPVVEVDNGHACPPPPPHHESPSAPQYGVKCKMPGWGS